MTKPAKTFKDLIVWQKAHRFVLAIYSLTETFPNLTGQMRRAAISIPANIAEGFRKRGESDKTRFLNVAQGSLEESRYYLILIQDLGCGTTTEIEPLLEESPSCSWPAPEPSSPTGHPLNSATPELLQLLTPSSKCFPLSCQLPGCPHDWVAINCSCRSKVNL